MSLELLQFNMPEIKLPDINITMPDININMSEFHINKDHQAEIDKAMEFINNASNAIDQKLKEHNIKIEKIKFA